jgi:hypothetical protein
MSNSDFDSLALASISASEVPTMLRRRGAAVVLERIARGGGATSWYFCRSEQDLAKVASRLSPGSVVSFYFDDRIARLNERHLLQSRLDDVMKASVDCVVGALEVDGISISVDFVTTVRELEEFLSDHEDSSVFFVGEFPARESDGENAVTFTLPDKDGVIRSHPH